MALGDSYITEADLANYLHIPDTDDDVELSRACSAGSRWVTRYCSREFNLADDVSERVFRPLSCNRAYVDDFPTTDGLIVKIGDNLDGSWSTTLTATDYLLEPFAGNLEGLPYNVIELRSRSFGAGTISVTAQWGWAEVPEDVKLATLIQSARLFGRRESTEGVLGGFDGVAIRVGTRVDPDVESLLQRYQLNPIGIA